MCDDHCTDYYPCLLSVFWWSPNLIVKHICGVRGSGHWACLSNTSVECMTVVTGPAYQTHLWSAWRWSLSLFSWILWAECLVLSEWTWSFLGACDRGGRTAKFCRLWSFLSLHIVLPCSMLSKRSVVHSCAAPGPFLGYIPCEYKVLSWYASYKCWSFWWLQRAATRTSVRSAVVYGGCRWQSEVVHQVLFP